MPTLPQGHYEHAVEGELLQQRAYQRREVLGERQVRALLSGGQPIPCYLPEEAAKALPLCGQIEVRLLAEVLPRQDETEAAPLCLCALGLARETSLAGLAT